MMFATAAQAADDATTAPFITTPDEVVVRMLELAGTRPDDLVVDLGSGDGRIVITAAQRFGARGLGIELDKALVARSRDNAARAGVAERVSFVRGDVLSADFRAASVVTVYLLPGLIQRLQDKFLRELAPGTRIVSHAFAMTSWPPDARETLRVAKPHAGQGPESALFLWIVPADVRGRWQATGTDLRIHQNFQQIELEGRLLGRDIASSRGSLRGDDMVWEANGLRFEGRLQGNLITGEVTRSDRREPLSLQRAR